MYALAFYLQRPGCPPFPCAEEPSLAQRAIEFAQSPETALAVAAIAAVAIVAAKLWPHIRG